MPLLHHTVTSTAFFVVIVIRRLYKPTHHTTTGQGDIIGNLFRKSTNYMIATSFSASCTRTCIDWQFSALICVLYSVMYCLSCWAAFCQLIINKYCIVFVLIVKRRHTNFYMMTMTWKPNQTFDHENVDNITVTCTVIQFDSMQTDYGTTLWILASYASHLSPSLNVTYHSEGRRRRQCDAMQVPFPLPMRKYYSRQYGFVFTALIKFWLVIHSSS